MPRRLANLSKHSLNTTEMNDAVNLLSYMASCLESTSINAELIDDGATASLEKNGVKCRITIRPYNIAIDETFFEVFCHENPMNITKIAKNHFFEKDEVRLRSVCRSQLMIINLLYEIKQCFKLTAYRASNALELRVMFQRTFYKIRIETNDSSR